MPERMGNVWQTEKTSCGAPHQWGGWHCQIISIKKRQTTIRSAFSSDDHENLLVFGTLSIQLALFAVSNCFQLPVSFTVVNLAIHMLIFNFKIINFVFHFLKYVINEINTFTFCKSLNLNTMPNREGIVNGGQIQWLFQKFLTENENIQNKFQERAKNIIKDYQLIKTMKDKSKRRNFQKILEFS